MRFGWPRLVVLLVLCVATLQVIHVLLLNRVQNVDVGSKVGNSTTDPVVRPMTKRRQRDPATDLTDMVDVVRSSSVLDANGEYLVGNY